jgi:hypothetical protein
VSSVIGHRDQLTSPLKLTYTGDDKVGDDRDASSAESNPPSPDGKMGKSVEVTTFWLNAGEHIAGIDRVQNGDSPPLAVRSAHAFIMRSI